MNAVWNSYGQLCGCPEIFKKSCKFFCRELDIRVPQNVRLILKHGKSVDTLAKMQIGEVEKFHCIASLLARPGRGVMLPL